MPFFWKDGKTRSGKTLQARTLFIKKTVIKETEKIEIYPDPEEKRAFRSASRAFSWRARASLTLETALCLTLFIFASVCLMLPLKIMNTERKVQAALEAVGEDFSRYAYVKDVLESGEVFSATGIGDFAREFCGHLAAGAGTAYARSRVMTYVDTAAVGKVSLAQSRILEEGEILDLVLDYEIRLPFPVLGLPALERTARCRRRAWTGRPGKDYDGGGPGGAGEEEIVYVGKGSTRYHRSRSCHYLANNQKAVPRNQVDRMRNASGGKYYPCGVCGAGAGKLVYVLPNGSSYHSEKNCRAIVAYARAVRLSEVAHLGACSYCGGE